ncbi:MAG: MFS transporter, partial [Betaproteobacteria bacterium]
LGMTWFFMHDFPWPLQPKVVGEKRSVLSDLKTVFSNRELLKLAPVPFFVYGVFVSFQGLWVGPFLQQVYGMPQSVGSYFFIFISVGFVVTFPLVGFISDRIGRRKQVVLVGILLSLIGWILLTFFGGALADYQIIALFSFIGVSYGVAVVFLTIPVNLCPPEISGLAIGSLNIFNFVGGGFFQFFMGYLLDLTSQQSNVFLSWQIIFGVSAICVLIALLSAWRLNEKICG